MATLDDIKVYTSYQGIDDSHPLGPKAHNGAYDRVEMVLTPEGVRVLIEHLQFLERQFAEGGDYLELTIPLSGFPDTRPRQLRMHVVKS